MKNNGLSILNMQNFIGHYRNMTYEELINEKSVMGLQTVFFKFIEFNTFPIELFSCWVGPQFILGDPEVNANIYCTHATFPIGIRKITVQLCGNFWVTQYFISCSVSYCNKYTNKKKKKKKNL